MTQTFAAIRDAREEFLALVEDLRPELHRYCARITGSVIDGEDIVQETLAKAFYNLSLQLEVPTLRPWLFRIAHNTALDFLKSHGQRFTDLRSEFDDIGECEEAPDGGAVRAALTRFLSLPVSQRSAVILKDVLGHSLEEAASTMGTSVPSVKAALVRGRRTLREEAEEKSRTACASRAELERYAALFNQRDWDGLRALVSDECRLDLVSKAQRQGKEVGSYFARYAKEDVTLRVGLLEGAPALAAFVAGAAQPCYFMLLTWHNGRIDAIRDFRYVGYIAAEAEFELETAR